MKKPDIVLVKPGSQKQIYGALSDYELTAIEPPMWAALLAGFLRAKGYSLELFDAEVEGLDHLQTAKKIEAMKPLLALVVVSGTNPSASTMNMTGAGAIVSFLKELNPERKAAVSGLHPTALPEQTMREEKVDFVIQGEGFYTLPPLIEALRSGEEGGLSAIPGLWFRTGGQPFHSGPAPELADLDALPQPAWDLLPMTKYRAHHWHCFDRIDRREPYGIISTSLGCPFKCGFCCINSLFGKPGIRYRNPELIIDEIGLLTTRYGIRNIKILDEMFVLKESHVVRLCDLIVERGYDLNVWAYARTDTVRPSMLGKMKRAGINWLAYGFESGNDGVLGDANKGYKTHAVMDIVKMSRDEGFHIVGNYIFGLPEDDCDTMRQTLDLAVAVNAEWANFYCAMPYPGSQLYLDAINKGWRLPEKWEDYSQYSYNSTPLPTRSLSAEEVLKFRDKAFQFYYRNEKYLESISNKFGEKTTAYIKKMASHNLPRKYQTRRQPMPLET